MSTRDDNLFPALRRALLVHWIWLLISAPLLAQELPNGGAIVGAISSPGQSQAYTFFASARQNLLLRVADTSISGRLVPRLVLFGPNGQRLTAGQGGQVAAVDHVAPLTGTYTVFVSDASTRGTEIGSFILHFVRAPGANEGGALTSGSVRSGTIDVGDLDSYTFTANAGENVLVRIAETVPNGPLRPRVLLYGPSGEFLVLGQGGTVASLARTLPATGTYTVVVNDVSTRLNGSGGYNLHFVRLPSANEGGTLVNGTVRSGTIDVGDLDSYTFAAHAGENVTLRVASTGQNASLRPHIALYGPTGEFLVLGQGQTVGGISRALTSTGIYTVVINDNSTGADGSGSYNLYFVRLPGANEEGPLINGGGRSGTIDLGDLDSYTFTANAGESVRIRVTDTSQGRTLRPRIMLYGPDGVFIVLGQGNSEASVTHVLPVAGTYFVVVQDNATGLNGTGSYDLALQLTDTRFSYAALGDSYSSGEGVVPYRDAGDSLLSGCHRSTRAYPTLIHMPGSTVPISRSRAAGQFDFIACSGAQTHHVRASGEGQNGEPPQLARSNAVGSNRDLITISIGGNDAQFVPILKFCLAHNDCNGLRPFDPHSDLTLGDLAPLLIAYTGARVAQTHVELRDAAPNATIVVLGYPMLLGGTECAAAALPPIRDVKLSASEQAFLREANVQLNRVIAASAALAGLHFVSVVGHFKDHEVCGTLDDWINGVVLFNPKASFHPTSRGQAEYAKVANAFLESVGANAGFARQTSGLPRNPAPDKDVAPIVRPTAETVLPTFGDLQVALQAAPAGCVSAANVIVPGQSALLQGSGFKANETVTLSLVVSNQRFGLGQAAADASGNLNAAVVVPADVPHGTGGTVEALGAGENGAGLLLLTIARIEPPSAIDSDGDGVVDWCDNCQASANADQRDTNRDGYGNVCDADLDNDGIVNTVDLAIFKDSFGTFADELDADFDGNRTVDTLDLGLFKSLFGKPPGPSPASR